MMRIYYFSLVILLRGGVRVLAEMDVEARLAALAAVLELNLAEGGSDLLQQLLEVGELR